MTHPRPANPVPAPGSGEPLRLRAADGRELGARLFRARPEVPGGPAVLIAGATAVPQGFYRAPAAWLAEQGATVLTLDYRGIATSRLPGSIRRDPATMADWGRHDLDAGLAYLLDDQPGRPVTVIGHSAGGFLLALSPRARSAAAVLTVGTPNSYWRNYRGRQRLERFLQMHVGVPALTALTGRLPGSVLGGHALPGGVARQWARWSRLPGFLDADPSAGALPPQQRFAGPLATVYLADDPFAPIGMHRWVHGLYPGAAGRALLLPGHRRLGHFGAFRPGAEDLWAQAWDWLQGAASRPDPHPVG